VPEPKPPWQTVHGYMLASGVPIKIERFSRGLIITCPEKFFEEDNAYTEQEFTVTVDYNLEENIDEIEMNLIELVRSCRELQAELESRGRSIN
jgi:hypothetical protein